LLEIKGYEVFRADRIILPAIPASQEFERLVREGIPVVESFPVQVEQ
jgi:hypothetical protein